MQIIFLQLPVSSVRLCTDDDLGCSSATDIPAEAVIFLGFCYAIYVQYVTNPTKFYVINNRHYFEKQISAKT